ncbi:MAG: NAD(P)H-dependent FMN reductase [Planctomycetota bacterium]|jgi:NAD(P)H-dependent FMN reductase
MSNRTPRLIAFAGSHRTGSWNTKLIHAAAEEARSLGAEVEIIDLGALPMPIFDEDLEAAGTPENATIFKGKLLAADGFLISSPEYNSSYPALLKNVIDWASRPAAGEAPLAAFSGKACGLFAASPGGLGGIRMLPQLRNLLANIGVHVVPAQFGLSKAHEAFDDDGKLKDERALGAVKKVVQQTIEIASR